jgi:ribosomal protein L16 Arg81 hydroxylase
MKFAECIVPLTRDQFIAEHLGRAVAYFPGPAHRFSHLVTLDEISNALSRVVLEPGLIRVKHDGKDVVASDFISPSGKIKPAEIEAYLERGDTIFIEHSERLFDGIYSMANLFSDAFKTMIRATLIVVAQGAPSSLHWDTHDVFVCQVCGEKEWPVYRPVLPNATRPAYPSEVAEHPRDVRCLQTERENTPE